MNTPAAPLRLDLRGLHCPMPVLRARKALRWLAIGEAILVECTDPLSAIDLPHFAAEAGHQVTEQRRAGEILTFVIVRGR